MKTQKKSIDKISRRKFIGGSAALATIAFLPTGLTSCRGTQGRMNSKFGGVQIGVQTYSFRSMPDSAEDILGYLKEIGINSIEMMADPMEEFAGRPEYQGPSYSRGAEITDYQRTELDAARAEYAKELHSWRTSVSMDNYSELRKMYNDAGVDIHITRLGNPPWSDEEIDYAFNVARTLGSKGIKWEISMEAAKRISPFADRHGLYGILHNHAQPAQRGFSWDAHLNVGDNVMLNFDTGHYFGCTGRHPNGVIEKYHDRIVSLHLKDKTGPDDDSPDTNVMWGEGDTPIADILLLLKKNQWPIHADIELEYPIPEGSTAVLEVKRCLEFCKSVLT